MQQTVTTFDKNTSMEDVLSQLQNQMGMIKRTSGESITPDFPLKRPLMLHESKAIVNVFGHEFMCKHIDATGKILLFDPDNAKTARFFVTEDDLKLEMVRQKAMRNQ